jgi:exodeoxyribonuclease VII small subunit
VSATPKLDPDSMSYAELVTALEVLTEEMASGSIGIEEAAELYEMAGQLHGAAAARLAAVQERIARLRTTDNEPPDA